MKPDKIPTAAEKFIRERRMCYAGMYPTDFHFFLRMLSNPDDNWDENGLIVCTYNEGPQTPSLTEDGWKHAKHVTRCPTSWPMPDPRSAILNIPDNAEESWLHEIGMFVYHLEKWEPEHVEIWITTRVRLEGMGLSYQEDAITRNLKGYHAVREAVFGDKVKERINLILTERHAPKIEKKPVVEIGATVRFHTGVETTTVVKIIEAPGSRYINGGTVQIVLLVDPINGSNIHLMDNLIAVEFPKEKSLPKS